MPAAQPLYDDGFTIVYTNFSENAGLLPHTIIYLLNGNDTVTATSNSWVYVYGGMGNDVLTRWSGALAGSSLYGGDGDDTLIGGKFADKLYGEDGEDALRGNGGDDFLYGGQSKDNLRGGAGQDALWGGGGKDTFDFNATSESAPGAANRDVIKDFDQSEDDIVNLAGIDAKTGIDGNQKFTFIGEEAFHGVKGELRFSNGVVQGDTTGDAVSDLVIKLAGISSMTAADFVL